jgi:predicted AlkP superfamily pyrophosphatase or phosphodiesterase
MFAVKTFADIPAEIQRRVDDAGRVLLILLDAFGLEFLERHRDHPLVQRLDVKPLRTQFPSTTTAHVTTLHFGVPVEEHGLYEWNLLEPALGRMICPLRFADAVSERPDDLLGQLDPAELAPGPTVYERLSTRSIVVQPAGIAGSAFTQLATRGATVVPVHTLVGGVQAGLERLGEGDEVGYVCVYWDAVDGAGHMHGPDSEDFEGAARGVLDVLWHVLHSVQDLTVLFTADHGQVPVHPSRVDYLDEIWPELPQLLSHPRPAGSSRDAFLHVEPEHVDRVVSELGSRLEDRAAVRPAAELFGRVGPRLRARLGDVVVLPAAGRQAWLRSASANERWFRGHHGGLEEAETSTYLAELTV